MKSQAAIDFFGSPSALADRIGISPAAISQWGEYPPEPKQLLIQEITNGTLLAEEGCYARVIGLDKAKKIEAA